MLKYIVGLTFLALVYAEPSSEFKYLPTPPRKAVVTLSGGTAKGSIYFTETKDGILVTGTVSEISEGKHGFHVHAVGDISGGCASTLGHFNPHNVSHAARESEERHVGDLGNIVANASGVATLNFVDKLISLSGDHNIIGRAVVVHADEDDLGLGGHNDSKITGHAGGRIGCGVIGTLSATNGEERALSSLLSFVTIGLIIFKRI